METLVQSLVIAAITGITIIAYRHPKVYDEMYSVLIIVYWGAFLGTNLWNIAISHAYTTLIPIIAGDKLDESKIIMQSITINWWIILLLVFFFCYLMFLKLLPVLISDRDDVQKNS